VTAVDEHLFVGLMNRTPGREDEYDAWYERYHVTEVVRHVLGFESGRRYRLSGAQRRGVEPPWELMTVYRLAGDTDIAAMHQSVIDNRPNFTPGNGVIAEGHRTWVWTPVGQRLTATEPSPFAGGDEHLLVILSNPAEGREEEYNAWYDACHMPEALELIPGRVAARRYRLNDVQRPGQDPPWRYLTLYELRGDDVAALQRADEEVRRSGRLTPGNGVIAPDSAVWLYTAISAPIVRGSGAALSAGVAG
jgi:hypothetical protein